MGATINPFGATDTTYSSGSKSMRKPLVGVTGPDRGGWPAWILTRLAVWRADGRAVRITPSRSRGIEGLDALIIGGGADVNPSLYGEEGALSHLGPKIKKARRRHKWALHRSIMDFILLVALWLFRLLFSSPWRVPMDRKRDELESELIRAAVAKDIPILGICRGMQLISVVLGGSLHRDIGVFYEEAPVIFTLLPRKKIEITPRSRLHILLGETRTRVNSLHNQSVNRLGEGLQVTAREPNGVVQAIEHEDLRFVVGVQWHPEYLPQEPQQQNIFQALIDAATPQVLAATTGLSSSQNSGSLV